jgi:hypothetical protein
MPLTAYQLTGDAKYLGMFVTAFENMRRALTVGPDGFLGWYGKADPDYRDPAHPEQRTDAVISSFRVAEAVCDFISLIDANPQLRHEYAQQRREYLDLVENQLVKKHDVRGDYVDLGKGGAVYRTPAIGLKADSARLTLPHNKHSIIVHGLLALYRVTAKDIYLQKAVKLGTRLKHCLTLKNGHYEWNYWDPAGEWDVNPREPGRWKHWIGPEHRGGYYASSVAQAISLYEYGLVFDKVDLERFLKTQLSMCWNGDLAHPVWSRVDGTRPERYTQGEYIASALAPFSKQVAAYLYTGERQEERLRTLADDWQGGPVAEGWLRGKLLERGPALRLGSGQAQPYLKEGRRFLTKARNHALVGRLSFAVTPPGYQAPQTPQEMTATARR